MIVDLIDYYFSGRWIKYVVAVVAVIAFWEWLK